MPALAYAEAPSAAPVTDILDRGPLEKLAAGDEATWNDPRALPGWLSTTARREALAILRSQQRAVPTEDVADQVAPDYRDVATDLLDQ